jgi:uncharacterized protein (DUF2147 family)
MNFIKSGGLFVGLLLFSGTILAANLLTPVGLWKTIDDVTGKPRSLVRIQKHDDSYEAVIEKILPIEGIVDQANCINCEGDKKDKPIVGLQIMWDMKADGNSKLSGGQILDPKNGKVYKCSVHLEGDGSTLIVRGYLGISIFGRSQTWTRETEPATSAP